jgi:hypothetical protein
MLEAAAGLWPRRRSFGWRWNWSQLGFGPRDAGFLGRGGVAWVAATKLGLQHFGGDGGRRWVVGGLWGQQRRVDGGGGAGGAESQRGRGAAAGGRRGGRLRDWGRTKEIFHGSIGRDERVEHIFIMSNNSDTYLN